MVLIESLVHYIEDNTDLVIDTDLFIGTEQFEALSKCVVVSEFAGGIENWSGSKTQPIQVLAKDLTYLTTQALATTVYSILANKPGFDDSNLSDVQFCEVLNRPFPVSRDKRGCYIFSANFLLRMK